MCNDLYELMTEAKNGDEVSIMEIINKFKPLINKYSRKLMYDGSESDLSITLLDIIKKIPINENKKFKEEKYIVGYINTSIKNKYIQLSKKNSTILKYETELDIEKISKTSNIDYIDDKIFIDDFLKTLPDLQRSVLEDIYVYQESIADIAKKNDVSRQAINKAKNRGLNNLRKSFCVYTVQYT